MIGLLMIITIVIYILISIFIIQMVYKKFNTKKSKYIATVIMILIPTWDVIIGYPIYKLLCWNSAGIHIYKTVDNVEGFYVGEKNIAYEPHEAYDGYKYIDYKEMHFSTPTGKYYRSYWIDNNISKHCVQIDDDKWMNGGRLYSKHFQQGKCIVKKEIAKNDVSPFEYINKSITTTKIHFLNIRIDSMAHIKDIQSSKKISELTSVVWDGGWIYGFLSSIPVGNNWKIRYPKIIDMKFDELLNRTLKLKEGNKNGNN